MHGAQAPRACSECAHAPAASEDASTPA